MKSLIALCLIASFALILGPSRGRAEKIPDPQMLAKLLGARPVTLTVAEPHLSASGHPVEVAYLAFPAPAALATALGPDWATRAKTIEFHALDGYVSRIDVAGLTSGKAYLAFARADGAPFAVDNLSQNESKVPLGPYYLVWDNRADAKLLAEGARNWPYQVDDVSYFKTSDAALRPAGFDPALETGLANVKTNCLTCHKVNGYGGEKVGGNLALIARQMSAADFAKWVLEPSAMKPGTTMPPLSTLMPEAERLAVAQSAYDYLAHVPAPPEP